MYKHGNLWIFIDLSTKNILDTVSAYFFRKSHLKWLLPFENGCEDLFEVIGRKRFNKTNNGLIAPIAISCRITF